MLWLDKYLLFDDRKHAIHIAVIRYMGPAINLLLLLSDSCDTIQHTCVYLIAGLR